MVSSCLILMYQEPRLQLVEARATQSIEARLCQVMSPEDLAPGLRSLS